jgi:hypothetical protein
MSDTNNSTTTINNNINDNKTQSKEYIPYKFWHPKNTLLLFSFFSPFIVIFFFTFMGMYFSNFAGLLFLGTILLTILFRSFVLYKLLPLTDPETHKCNLINYSGIGTGDIYLSLWVFSFTLFYILIPLINSNGIERSLFAFIIIFILMFICDIVIKSMNGCYSFSPIKKPINIFLNIFLGGIMGLLFSFLYTLSDDLKKHLFFRSKSSSETCKQVNDTKFQCSFDFE